MSKYHLLCCCNICKRQITVQSLNSHLNTHQVKKTCKYCGSKIFVNGKQFCSKSCAAKYNNKNKNYSLFKPGPKPLEKLDDITYNRTREQHIYIPVSLCLICKKYYPSKKRAYNSKTCSNECKSVLLSNIAKQRIQNGFNPNVNRGRKKRSYLEQSFENWITTNYPTLSFITEYPFKRHDMLKTYFVDFYFPDLYLGIELDGSQHQNTINYDLERDFYIKQQYNVDIVRITHKQYRTKEKIFEIKRLLERRAGIEPA